MSSRTDAANASELDNEYALFLMGWAENLTACRLHADAEKRIELAWQIWGERFCDDPDLVADRADTLYKWGWCRMEMHDYSMAALLFERAYLTASQFTRDPFAVRYQCAASWAEAIFAQGNYWAACEQFAVAANCVNDDRTVPIWIAAEERIRLLLRWTEALVRSRQSENAREKLDEVHAMLYVELAGNFQLNEERAQLQMLWGINDYYAGFYSQAIER